MGEHAYGFLSVQAFRTWDPGDDLAYELYAGHAVAMAPPTAAHTILTSNLARHLGNALDGRGPCTVRSEAGIIDANGTSWFQADLAVTCQPHRPGQVEVIDPILVVEVLSPSTEENDRKVKLPAYRGLSSVREVVLVDPRRVYCEVHRRVGEHWQHEILVDASEVLRLETVGLVIGVGRVYAGIELEVAVAGA